MSNQRSVMTEFRFLDQKRQAEGLTPEEAARYGQLRDLVGAEAAPAPRSGFDVNAAAARLRESLLPAGLRHRPAEAAPPPPPEPAPEAAPAPEALALEQAWAEAPFAALTSEPADPLFDPGSLAQEVRPQAWNPEAPGYDPNAPYDEAAWIAAGYDPTATYDWSAYGYGPDGQPVADAAAPAEGWAEAAPGQPIEPAADLEAPAEPLDAQPLELDPQPLELGEPALELGEAPLEASADAWDATPVEAAVEAAPEAWETAEEAAAAPASPAWEAPIAAEPEPLPEGAALPAEEELPFDPNAPFDHAKWFGRATAGDQPPAGPEPLAEPAPMAEAVLSAIEPEGAFDLGAEAPAAPPAFGEYDDLAAPAVGLLAEEAPLEALPEAAAPGLAEEPPLAPVDEAAGWLGEAPPALHEPAPAGAPFGEYDEAAAPLPGAPGADGPLEAMLHFDPAAASAIEPGAVPEGYDLGGPSLDPAALPPAEPGPYDDAAFSADQMYGGPEGDDLPGGAPLELGEGVPDWQPESALEQGFELASDGSFGQGAPPAHPTPAWGSAAAAAPVEGWESAPALDLGAPFEQLAPEPEALAEPPPAGELPTIDGAELLEELPPEEGAPPLELGAVEPPPGPSSLDGAFELEPAVEAAAYPPPDAVAAPDEATFDAAAFDATAFGTSGLAGEEGAPAHEPEPEPAISYELAPEAVADQQAPEAPPAEAAPEPLPPEIAAAFGEGPAGEDPFAAPAAAPPADTFEPPPAVSEALFDPPLAAEPEPLEAEPLPPPTPTVRIAGSHRVVLHTVDGQVKRGLLVDALLDAPALALQPQGPGAQEEVPTDAVKAIFFMLAPGEKAPAPEGKKVRVTFRDGRQVAGFSPDYQEGLVGFFMIPADTRTNTGRIWVYQGAVKAVAVS